MNVEDLVAKAKELISDNKLDEAKQFIEDNKDTLGDKFQDLTGLLGGNTDGIIDKVKDFFGGKK